MLGSLVLHGLVVLLVFFMPSPALPPAEPPLPVELVTLGETSIASAGLAQADRLRQQTPPAAAALSAAPPPPSPTVPLPGVAAEPAKPRRPATATPRKTRPPVDAFDAMLQSLRMLRRPAVLASNAPPQTGLAPSTQAERDGSLGRRGTLSVRDFIRAEIERHWEFDVATLGTADLVIALHLVLRSDGTVSRAEIVDDPRYTTDPAYRQLADSVRRAAQVASPLQLPPGIGDAFRDMTLRFNPREAVH